MTNFVLYETQRDGRLKIDILDIQGKSREQLRQWLLDDKRVEAVEVFENCFQFIEQVGNSPPDICVIRLGCNEIPGLKTADMVRQISTDIRIIFISDDREYALDAYEVGAFGYLLCPVKRDKLEKYLMMKKEM